MTEYKRSWKDLLHPITCVKKYHERAEPHIGRHPKIDRYISTSVELFSAYRGSFLGLSTVLVWQGLEALLKN
jgi:hypothetical protein